MPKTINSGRKGFLKALKNGLANIVLATAITAAPTTAAYTLLAPAAAYAKECTPHYLKGLAKPKNKLEGMLEKDRVYNTMLAKYPANPRVGVINGSIEVNTKIHGVDVRMTFPNYVRTGGKVKHYHALGIDTYTEEEFQCMVKDNAEYIKRSAELAMKDYERTFDRIIKAQEKALKNEGKLKESENLKGMLDMELPGYSDLKLRDILFTPDIKLQDFVPSKYYFGEIAALGVTYISVGIVGIDPKARVLDHLNEWPAILVHEMTHNNQKIQNYPLLGTFDPELWASFPMLVNDDMGRFMSHGYLKDVRKVSKILFNFDSELAYDDLVSLDLMMGTEIESGDNYKKLREYMQRVTEISQAIRDVAFNEYIPEYYTHPMYYMTLNGFLKDKNASFKLIIYKNFEPTLLGGPEKTRDFVQENTELIKGTARETMQDLKGMQNKKLTEIQLEEIRKELKARLSTMSPEEKKMLLTIGKQLGMPTTGKIDDLIHFGLRMYQLGIIEFDPTEEESPIR